MQARLLLLMTENSMLESRARQAKHEAEERPSAGPLFLRLVLLRQLSRLFLAAGFSLVCGEVSGAGGEVGGCGEVGSSGEGQGGGSNGGGSAGDGVGGDGRGDECVGSGTEGGGFWST